MKNDIDDNEIRIIGPEQHDDHGTKLLVPKWCIVAGAAVLIAVVLYILWPFGMGGNEANNGNVTSPEPEATEPESLWYDNYDDSIDPQIIVADTVVDSLHLLVLTPVNAVPELHMGPIDVADTDILLAAMAADLRRDNNKIVGAFVLNGVPLSWGLSKRGYCAIIDGHITLGVADNSPLFEQATEQGGSFFRQYPAVDRSQMVLNNPENASYRRALCVIGGKVRLVASTDRVLMNDFSRTLVKLGASDAIFLVGGTSNGWARTPDGDLLRLGTSYSKNKKYVNYIVFRKS